MSYTLLSKDFSDEQMVKLPLVDIFIQIRKCQILCKQSQRTTFCGSMMEFSHAHDMLDRVQRERPVEKQRRLIQQMRQIGREYDDELLRRCSDYADKVTGWNTFH